MIDVLSQLLLTAQPASAGLPPTGQAQAPVAVEAASVGSVSVFAALLGQQLAPACCGARPGALSAIAADIRVALGAPAAAVPFALSGDLATNDDAGLVAGDPSVDVSALIAALGRSAGLPGAVPATPAAGALEQVAYVPTGRLDQPALESLARAPAEADEIAAAPEISAPVLPAGIAARAGRLVEAATVDPLPAPAGEGHALDPTGQREASALQPLSVPHRSLPAGDAGVVLRIHAPAGAPHWGHEVGQRLIWLSGQDGGRAELVLTPPQLGRIEVSLTMNGDQANAQFVAAHPGAREFLEQALPRLRDQLAEAGITLGQASVNAETPQDDSRETSPQPGFLARADAGLEMPAAPAMLRIGLGLIDTFA